MEEPEPICQLVTEALRARAVNGTVRSENPCSTWGMRRIVHPGEKPQTANIPCTDPERYQGPAEPRIQTAGTAFARATERSTETKLHQRHHSREIGKDKWAKRVEHCLAYPSTMMGSEAVPMGHHDEQGVTLGKSSASTSRRHYHALYFGWRQVFTATAGVI